MTLRSAPLTRRVLLLTALSAAAVAVSAQERGGEWAQWRGPNRDGISRETGLLKSWPQGGPRLLWKSEGLGGGYATPSVAGGRIYGMGYRGDDEVVWALDERTGQPVWSTRIAAANHDVGYGEGSRSTPTVVGNRLYVLGVSGDVVCLNTADGKPVWQKNLVREFGGAVPNWGYSESPLVDGQKVIVTPGGPQATLVALDRNSGNVIWRSQVPQGDPAHYASAIAAEVDGVRQYIQFLHGGVVGVAAEDGRFLWRYNRPASGTANIATPVFQDNMLFAAAAYNVGGGLVKLARTPNGVSAEEVYFTRDMKNKHGGMVLVDGYLYGFDDPGTLTCVEFKTGETKWQNRSVGGNGSVVYADGNLYCRSQSGPVALVEANPSQYVEKGRFEPQRSNKNAWAHPVIAGGKLLLRDQDFMLCYDVKAR
ncbi:MAG: PQQ-binding-like beta-propeller repeat protein [Armatimonadota bacterium]